MPKALRCSVLAFDGYVLLMRHAGSPTATPSPQTADPENKVLEQQLGGKGRTTATAMGVEAFHIPVGTVKRQCGGKSRRARDAGPGSF
jgi:hypothetical protein